MMYDLDPRPYLNPNNGERTSYPHAFSEWAPRTAAEITDPMSIDELRRWLIVMTRGAVENRDYPEARDRYVARAEMYQRAIAARG